MDREGQRLQEIVDLRMLSRRDCVDNRPALIDLEPSIPPPPKAEDLIIIHAPEGARK